MFRIILLIFCLGLYSCATTNSDNSGEFTPKGAVISYGVFARSSEDIWYWKNKLSTNPVVKEGSTAILLKQTDTIPLLKGIYFAFKYKFRNLPEGDVQIHWEVIHPVIKKPDGSLSTGYSYKRTVNVVAGYAEGISGYSLDEDYEMVAGDWTFIYSYDGQVLATQTFHLVEN